MMKSIDNLRKVYVWLNHTKVKYYETEKTSAAIKIYYAPVLKEDSLKTTNKKFRENMHNNLKTYYRRLAKSLLPYDEIFIWGPKTPLRNFHNYLLDDPAFMSKRISTVEEEDMTETFFSKMVENNLNHKKLIKTSDR